VIKIHRNQILNSVLNKITNSKEYILLMKKEVRFEKDKDALSGILLDLSKASIKTKELMKRLEKKKRKFWK